MTGGRRVVEKANEGEYLLVDPFDYIILGFIPEEGQLALGLYPLGETVINIRKKFTPEQQKGITTTEISGRLVSMKSQGLAKNMYARAGDKHIWQRTKVGSAVLNEWKGANGGGNGGKAHGG